MTVRTFKVRRSFRYKGFLIMVGGRDGVVREGIPGKKYDVSIDRGQYADFIYGNTLREIFGEIRYKIAELTVPNFKELVDRVKMKGGARSFNDMLKEYLPTDLIKAELSKNSSFWDNIKVDHAWEGATIAIPVEFEGNKDE